MTTFCMPALHSIVCPVSIGWHWLIHDGNGSVESSTGWYLAVLGQHGAVMVGTG